MHIEAIRYFIELTASGSFYSAAKKIHISQQGLNKAITTLEAELGVKLLERGSRGVRLTKRGEIFLEHAENIISEYEHMLDKVYTPTQSSSAKDERITIHASYFCTQLALSVFEQRHIMEQANLIETSYKQMLEKAAASDGTELFLVDLYSKALKQLKTSDELIFDPVLRSRAGVVWKEGGILDGSAAIHREQLAGISIATNLQRDMAKLLDEVFEGHSLPTIALGTANPRTTLEFAHTAENAAATFDSFGFMLAQRGTAMRFEGLRFAPFANPSSNFMLGFLYPKRVHPNLRAGHMIDVVRKTLIDKYPDYFAKYPIDAEGSTT